MVKEGNTYIEPFVGSGAVALSLQYPRMIINDKNIKLMNFYRQVQKRPEKLYRKISKYVEKYKAAENQESFYYSARQKYNELTLVSYNNGLTHAALFWFLNKTDFNGMYRETQKGDFNIPFGKRDCPEPCLEDFMSVSKVLQNCSIHHKQFDVVCNMAKSGDVVYLDPPYIPISLTSSFSGYLRYGFNLDSHRKLCRIMNKLSDRGVYVVMNNSDCETTREIYSDLKGFEFTSIETKRFISGKAEGRRKINDLIICNKI